MPVLDDQTLTGILAVVGPTSPAQRPGDGGRVSASAAGSLRHRTSEPDRRRHLRAAPSIERDGVAAACYFGLCRRSTASGRLEPARENPARHPERRRAPLHLDASQQMFDVRFADGTPLNLENSPVVEAIRNRRSSGPTVLRVRRAMRQKSPCACTARPSSTSRVTWQERWSARRNRFTG